MMAKFISVKRRPGGYLIPANGLGRAHLMMLGKIHGTGFEDLDAAYKALEAPKPIKLFDFTGGHDLTRTPVHERDMTVGRKARHGGVVGHDRPAKQTSMESSPVCFTWVLGLVSDNL
jgi:hypothetical protein